MTVSTDAPLSTWDLVQRVQQGDSESFGIIYDQHVDRIYRYVMYRVRDHQLAEDLTADTFYRALKSINSFTWQNREIENWLYTIAGRLVLDDRKSSHRKRSTPVPIPDLPASVSIHGQSNGAAEFYPERTVVDHIAHVELLDVVMQLDHEMRDCLVLRFLMERSVTETAEIMGKTEGSVKTLTYRAIRAVRDAAPHLAKPVTD